MGHRRSRGVGGVGGDRCVVDWGGERCALAPPPQFWSLNGNESLRPGADQVGSLTNTSNVAVAGVSSQFADHSKKVVPASWVGAYQPAERDAYAGGLNVTTVAIDDGGRRGDPTRLVQQSVIGFVDAQAAQNQFSAAST